MTIAMFNKLHLHLQVHIPNEPEKNSLPSATDPTQDIPVKIIQFAANGQPLNVKEHTGVYSNLQVFVDGEENLTAIERQYTDKFDVLGEYQKEISKVRSFIKDNKQNVQPKKDEKNEK